MSQSTQKFDIDNQQLSLAGSDLSISKGNTITLPLEIPIGGTSGQLLAKQSDTNYDVTWVNEAPASSYTSVIKHKVKAGESLTKGQAVYVSSADGTNMIVTKASNTSEATSSKTMGLIAQTLANNGQGDIIAEGLLSGLNTNTATIGDPVWLGTNGNLIYGLTNKPYAPAHLVFIGIVTRVSATVGEIFVKVQNGFELTEIHDVDLKTTAPVNGDILGYNGTLWVNKTITKTTVGLGNVDNTSDASKPVSTATQTALNLKANLAGANTFTGSNTFTGGIISNGGGGISTNTAIGSGSLNANTTGNNNTAIGINALSLNTIGNFNTANGVNALSSNTTGNGNVAFGLNAAKFISGGSIANTISYNSVFIGTNTYPLGDNQTNQIVIGHGAIGNGTNTTVLGNTNTTQTQIFGNTILSNTAQAVDSGDKLQVSGTSKFTDNITLSNDKWIGQNSNNNIQFGGSNVLIRGGADVFIGGNGAFPFASNHLVVKSTGNIGIGTGAPQNLLHIKGTATVGVGVRNSHFIIESTETAGVDVGAVLKFGGQSGNAVNPYSFGTIEAKKESAVANNYSSYLAFYTIDNAGGSTERMRISSSGNIGIGTTSPAQKLSVLVSAGTAIPTVGSAGGHQILSNGTYGMMLGVNSSGNGWIQAARTDATATNYNLLLNPNGGNVGIGTTTPTSKLQVVGLPTYESNALALAGGLTAGAFYRTSMGVLMVTF